MGLSPRDFLEIYREVKAFNPDFGEVKYAPGQARDKVGRFASGGSGGSGGGAGFQSEKDIVSHVEGTLGIKTTEFRMASGSLHEIEGNVPANAHSLMEKQGWKTTATTRSATGTYYDMEHKTGAKLEMFVDPSKGDGKIRIAHIEPAVPKTKREKAS